MVFLKEILMPMSLMGFADFIWKCAVAGPEESLPGLEKAAKIVEKQAKKNIGYYQSDIAPFADWAPLAESTLYGGVNEKGQRFPGKVQLGYSPPDNPLLREGTLRDNITHDVEADIYKSRALIGVKSKVVQPVYSHDPVDIGDVAMWQEFGTEKIPPRSFLGAAAVQKETEIVDILAEGATAALFGRNSSLKIR